MEKEQKPSRRAFLKHALRLTGAVSLELLGGALYVRYGEPVWLKTEHITVPISSLPPSFDGYRLVQLSDIHLTGETSYRTAQRAVDIALALNPDLIVLTGDYVTRSVDQSRLANTLKPLAATNAVYAILGNHDHWTDAASVRRGLDSAGIPELQNEHTEIKRGGASLWLAGIDDIWVQKHNIYQALHGIPEGAATILLAHEPDFADTVVQTGRVSLQLSGHSHGGQVRIPGVGIAPITPYLGSKYVRGLFNLGSMHLYTNRGVGNLHPVRLNCRPEVTEITLRQA